jgi:hypothetical protein
MNREQIIAAMQATSVKPRPVHIEGWGTLYVKVMTVEQVDLQNQSKKLAPNVSDADDGQPGKDRFRFARGAAQVLCDENGKLLFDAQNQQDLELIASQPWEKMQAILTDAGEDNATSEAGVAAVKKA